MSWTKKPQGGPAPPGAERQLYSAPQPQQYNNQQNLYQNYHTASTNNQQQFWPSQQPQFNQQYGQAYQQDVTANANQYYHPQQNYNQYNNPQSGYGQNLYQNQPIQQQNVTQKTNSDIWEDNWDWGWDEASKQAQKQQNMVSHQANSQQQVFNNANVIEESFATTDSWNWSMDEKKEANDITQTKMETPLATLHTINSQKDNNIVPEPTTTGQRSISNVTRQIEDIKTLNDREAIKEQLPNLALGKRFHLENLTPQWSIESQMSQDSSDGPQTHSETYRSENQSRNSNKSSPGLNTGSCNFNYSQPALDDYPSNIEWSKKSDTILVQGVQNDSRRNSEDELASSIKKITLGNHETPIETLQESSIIRDSVTIQPSLNMTAPNFPPPMSSNSSLQSHSILPVPPPVQSIPPQATMILPRPPSSTGSLPRPPSATGSLPRPPSSSGFLPLPPSSSTNLPASSATLPPPLLSVSTLPTHSISNPTLQPPLSSTYVPPANLLPPNLPPPNIPPQTSSTNPFKHAGPFSHKTNNKHNANATPMQFPSQMSSTHLISQPVVNKVTQHRLPVGFEANLETTPDNSERPDQPQMTAFRTMPVMHQVPENLEVAPQNDRNEYLQTAHLSGGDYGENTVFTRNVPPPGLRRMVVGQQETEYSQSLNMPGDEPPPGLARMVPGQQNETETAYNQAASNYMDRQIDGQPTDSSGRPYRQADGQQTPDNYTQSNTTSNNERLHLGLNRMVPGESSNSEYSQYQSSTYGGNEERVVTGVDHNFSMSIDAGPTDVREQNVDGSDYTEQITRNPPRNIIGAHETSNLPPDYGVLPDEQQREVTMEGENLQDLSNITSTEMTFSREQIMEGSDGMVNEPHKTGIDRKTDLSDSVEHPVTSSRKQSLNRVNTSGEESERDRTFNLSPRRDRDKHRSSRDREKERDRDRDRERDKEGRFSRSDRKYDRDERRSGRDDKRSEKEKRDRDRDRRERVDSPDGRKHRRSNQNRRYETEDTDYYSDKERERRHYREGSYASRPPRRDDKDRRSSDKDRSRRYNTTDRYRNYDDEWNGAGRSRRSAQYLQYRDIDPAKKYGSLRKEREDERRRGEQFSSLSRPESREATVTDDDLNETRRRTRRHQRSDPYYDGYGGGVGGGYTDPYALQPQQYQYYELLRMTDPEAYMQVYKQVMAGHPPPAPPPHLYSKLLRDVYGEGYASLGYEGRLDKRGGTNSVHSGRSSTTGLKGNDTLYGCGFGYRHESGRGSLRDAPSLRTDLSDRDLNTDASLNLHLEESTVRSERMTPFRYSTAHMKGSVSSRHVVVVQGSYPVDGLPATVQVLSLQAALAHDPLAAELAAYPGPLLKGVSHKKSVIEYCLGRVRSAPTEPDAERDLTGYVLIWELLALLLRQNGVVVGSDIAELLMKNTREYEYRPSATKSMAYDEGRRASSMSGEGRDEEARNSSPDQNSLSVSDVTRQELSSPGQPAVDEKMALDRFREYLIYGNRQEALEWAMSQHLWGHALQLAAHGDRRTRACVSSRFLAAQPRTDPLHTLYAALAGTNPPAATCVSEERWGDWRPHAAMLLSNSSSRPEQDRKTLTQLGDSLSSRGLVYSAQFCYVSAGVQFSTHPLAPLQLRATATVQPPAQPPRLSLLLAEPRANSLSQFATNKAIFATEIYEYALSLSQDYVIADLQVYKVMAAARLCDCGQYERALAYAEQAARALTRSPQAYSPALATVLADLAERLKYHDPGLQEHVPLQEETDGAEPSPTHQQSWIHELKSVAHMLSTQSQHHTQHHEPHQPLHHNHQYGWTEQAQHYQQPIQSYPEPVEETPDYAAQYYGQQTQMIPHQVTTQVGQQMPQQIGQQIPQQITQHDSELQVYPTYGEDWHKTEEHHAQSYADPYWQPDTSYGYGEAGGGEEEQRAGEGEARPAITMPGAKPAHRRNYDDDRPPSTEQTGDQNTDSPKSAKKPNSKSKDDLQKSDGKQKSGWLGGILTKLSLRPPNQMILPDDKNPSIVWDEDKKRWRNVDGDTDETERPAPPPPRVTELPPALRSGSPPLQATPGAPAAPLSNIFKMQKGRHIKKSYVDVFNPSGAPTRPLPPAAEVLGPVDQLRPVTYLVPAPAHHSPQSGIYDPAQVAGEDDQYRSGI